MEVSWHVGSDPFCSGGDVSDVNQLPAPQETTVTKKGFAAELREAWQGLQLRNMAHSVRNSQGSLRILFVICNIKNQMIRSISVGLQWPPLHPPFFNYI